MASPVFLSSTRLDLIPHRDAVSRRLRQAGYWPIEMETFGARDQEPLEASLQEVKDSELFVGIYARRYGFVPKGSTRSITEQELLEAERQGIPVFCFLLDDNVQGWAAELREGGEGARKLEALKRFIQDRWVVARFTTPEDLAAGVVASLDGFRKRQVEAQPTPERRVQLALLHKVERFWLDGVLRRAVPEGWRLHTGREERPEAVGRPALEEIGEESELEPIADVFLHQGKSLLFLGDPGSGKTITLLELARGLARVARRDPGAAVPVVFNLASWKGRDRSLADWMAVELDRRYQAGLQAAKKWIEDKQILPLLDGLDEVEQDCRHNCVDAINAYLQKHGLAAPGMAVACHTQVYEELPARLQLENALALQPLAPTQVDEHLEAAGPELAGLRSALAGDPGLRELAVSPLMLNLLARTFRNAAPEALPADRSAVFEAFVTRMLEPGRQIPWAQEEIEGPRGLRRKLPWNRHRGASAPPPPEGVASPGRTRRSLAWLARGMAEHDPALFQVERLQPAWLASRLQVFAYAVLSRALGGGLLALPLALAAVDPRLGAGGLLAGALMGALETIRLGWRPQPAGRPLAAIRRAGGLLLLGGAAFAAVLLTGLLWRTPTREVLPLGLLFAVVFGLRGAGRGGHSDIRVAEALVWRAWSWWGAAIGAGSLLIISLVFWALFPGSSDDVSYLGGAEVWVPISLIATVLGGIFGAFSSLVGKTLEKNAWPNQGTWLSLRNAGMVGLVTGLAAMLFLGLTLGGLEVAGRVLERRSVLPRGILPWIPLGSGLALGIWAGLAYSGLDFVQHFCLRLVLRLWNLMPRQLVSLLDHAVERGLVQRIGGSYKFFHPLLQEFFAKRDDGAGDGIRTRDQQLGRL